MNSVVLDIPRLHTGLAEWLACMVMVAPYRKSMSFGRFWSISVSGLAAICAFLILTDNIALWLWVPCMAFACAIMLTLILLLGQLDFRSGIYTCIRAFILAEFAAALQWQIHCFFWPDNAPSLWEKYSILILVYGLVFLVMYFLEQKHTAPMHISSGELTTVVMIGICVFAVSNLSFYFHDTPFSGQYASEIMNIRTFADLGGLAILFAYNQHRAHLYAQRELDAMQTILENQYTQYRMSRDSIDLINRKYHDLKHQINALRSEQNPALREQWLNEMEADIRNYEAQNKTGNSVLDTVLTGKSLYCQKHGITLSVMADGSGLEFMDVMDICTVFGNVLDNAIECELKIKDKSMRAIHLTLTTQKQFLVLRVENYCPDPPAFRGGLPVSTKNDPVFHGFGIKSIQHTARKYGGTLTCGMEESWFVLKMLIPLHSTGKYTNT